MYTIFSSSMNTKANRNNISNHFRLDASAAYAAACSIIDYKTPMVQNIMSDMARYMEKRKHLISAAVVKLLKRAKLSIAVYCIKTKLNNAATKCKKKSHNDDTDDDAPMQNLTYRTAALKRPMSVNRRRALKSPRVEGLGGVSRLLDHQRVLSTPTSVKRPPNDVLSSRIKRLKQCESTPYSEDSELSDEDTDSGDP